MGYYDEVYLARLNAFGESRQERIVNAKEKFFEKRIEKSIYKTDFWHNNIFYTGLLEPDKWTENGIFSIIKFPRSIVFSPGTVLLSYNSFGEQQLWLIIFVQKNDQDGFIEYKTCLLDRELSWWNKNKVKFTVPVVILNMANKNLSDAFKNIGSLYREDDIFVNILMSKREDLFKEDYCLLNGIDTRGYIVAGLNYEAIPGLQFVTLSISALRNEEKITEVPFVPSFWGGN